MIFSRLERFWVVTHISFFLYFLIVNYRLKCVYIVFVYTFRNSTYLPLLSSVFVSLNPFLFFFSSLSTSLSSFSLLQVMDLINSVITDRAKPFKLKEFIVKIIIISQQATVASDQASLRPVLVSSVVHRLSSATGPGWFLSEIAPMFIDVLL